MHRRPIEFSSVCNNNNDNNNDDDDDDDDDDAVFQTASNVKKV